MSPAVIAIVFGLLAAAAAFGIRQGLITGVAGDDLYRFRRDENPLGFAAVMRESCSSWDLALPKSCMSLKLCGDPMAPLRTLFG